MKGVYTALITPFKKSGGVDYRAFQKLLKIQGDAGIHGVVPCGTTGESATLNHAEKKKLIEISIKTFKGSKTKVIAGTGSNNTLETVELSKWASKKGADAVLIVTPYYNKPTQRGLIAHYEAVSKAITCEMVPYNVPGRTNLSMTTETILLLSKMKRVSAIKEASGDLEWDRELMDQLSKTRSKMDLLTGDDVTFLPFLLLGGKGIISVASNLIPADMVEIFNKRNKNLFKKWSPLFSALFIETNPGPIKYAMKEVYGIPSDMRLPLVPVEPSTKKTLLALIRGLK